MHLRGVGSERECGEKDTQKNDSHVAAANDMRGERDDKTDAESNQRQ